MKDTRAHEIWNKILEVLDEKLQYAFLNQARSVKDVRFEGSELVLVVSSPESVAFLNSDLNQQRLMIISRSLPTSQNRVGTVERFRIELVEDEDS